MKLKRCLSFVLVVWLALLMSAGEAFALPGQPAPQAVDAQAVGTAFTYQGQLKDSGGNPVTASCDLKFGLWNALSGPTQVGITQTVSSVNVNGGLFTVSLNGSGEFGTTAFDGNPRWLAIAVRCGTDSSDTALSPRQSLTPAPYALYSTNADQLDGLHAASFQQRYQNIVVVAKSGGNYTSIVAALTSISTASASNPYLIYVAPGVYTETITMKPYVDIEGAGEQATKITYIGSADLNAGTVIGANNAELRFLTVENTGGAFYATAIYNPGVSPHLTHITAQAAGGSETYSVFNYNSSSPTMNNVTAVVTGTGVLNYGVYNYINSSPAMNGVTAVVTGTGGYNRGVYNYINSSPAMNNIIASAAGGLSNIGVDNDNNSSPTMSDVTAKASGASGDNYGVLNTGKSSPTMKNVTAVVTGPGSANYGVFNALSSPTIVDLKTSASGGATNYGVYNNGSSPAMNNISAVVTATSGTTYGVYNTSSSPKMANSMFTVLGGTNSYGVYNISSSSPTIANSTVTASGGTYNHGVYNTSSSPTIANSTVTASGGSNNYGVWNDSSSLSIQNSTISASDGTYDGIHNIASSGSYTVTVNASQITGGPSTIYQDSHYTTRVGASQLVGNGAFGGTYVCVASYDENYAAVNTATCNP